MTTCYRMISTNNWKKYGTSKSHTCIQDEMQQNIPVAGMCRDYTIPHFSFENQFAVDIPEREHWLDDDHHPIPPSSQTVYTDGSGVCWERMRASPLMDSQVFTGKYKSAVSWWSEPVCLLGSINQVPQYFLGIANMWTVWYLNIIQRDYLILP